LVGLEKTACLIDRCAVYELLYLNEATAASGNLEKSMLQLYTAILKFLAKAIERSKCAQYSRRTRLPPLILSQITTSRQYSQRETLPITSMISRNWRKRLHMMLLSPKHNVLFTAPYQEKYAKKLTLCTSYTGGARERSNTTSRYQHDNVTLWASNRRNTAKARRHAAKARRHESSRISQQRLVRSQYTSVQKIRDPGMGVHNSVHRTPQADQRGAPRRNW